MWTWSVSTSLRSRVSAVAGMPSLSSRMTSSLRPAICQPLSSQKSSQPLYMSLPAWAMAPDRGARKPILIGPWANAAPAASIVIAAIVTAVSLRIDVPSLAILVLRLRILRPGHSTRTSAARSRLDRAAFCGTIAAFAGGLHGPSTMALLTPLTRDEVAPDLVSLWDECERVYPDFRHLWATMAHSPIVIRHVWGQLLDLKRESPVDARHFETATGLGYVELVEGTGARPKPGDSVKVHYTGWLKSGQKFDSSHDRGEPLVFPIGRGRVIKGWDEGVGSMRVGGKRKLIIPAHLGYGDRGAGGVIPPGATLIFEVELVGIDTK